MILSVDPLLEPANGPNWFPFDPEILYELKVDNNNDAVEDVVFQFRFPTERGCRTCSRCTPACRRGIVAPANSPAPVPPGTLIVPPRITSFARRAPAASAVHRDDGKGGVRRRSLTCGAPFYAVPTNVGPRTMDYDALFNAGTYNAVDDIRVFAGTTDDPFWIDLGGGVRHIQHVRSPRVLSPPQDAAKVKLRPDTVRVTR